MDKGIRPAAIAKFNELNELRRVGAEPYNGDLVKANALFRRHVNTWLEQEFGITHAAACTHYAHALREAKRLTPALVENLGRAEDKKGGRKKKVVVITTAAAPQPVLLLTYNPTPRLELDMLLQRPQVPLLPVVQAIDDQLTPDHEVQTEYVVKRKRDGTIVAEGLTLEAARAMVQRAAAGKKAALYFV